MVRYLPLVVKNVLRNRRRSVLTVLSVAASFCLIGVLLGLYHAFFLMPAAPDQSLRIIIRNRTSIANSVPISYRDRIRKVPGVREITVFQFFGGTYKDSRDMRNFFGRFAVEPQKLFTVSPQYRIDPDERRAFERERASCIVGRAIANRLNLHVGDRVTLVGDIYPVTLQLTIRGIYDAERETDHLYFHYEYLREASHTDWVGMFLAIAEDAKSVPRICEEIDAMFENSTAQTKSETERAFTFGFLSYLGDVKSMMFAVCAALTFTVLLVTANTMTMSVRERVREVGILKTLGFTPGAVLGIILGESALIAAIGGAAGLLMARGIVEALRHAPTVFVSFATLGVPAWVIAATILLAVIVGVVSSIVPAWTASRRPIVTCLRFTG